MIRKAVTLTLALLVGMALFAPPASAVTTVTKKTLGYNETGKECHWDGANALCVWTEIDTDLKVHTERAWAEVRYRVVVPTGCANNWGNCRIIDWGWTVNNVSSCNAAGAWLDFLASTADYTFFRVIVGTDESRIGNCRIATVHTTYRW